MTLDTIKTILAAILALAIFRFAIPFAVVRIENALRRFFNLPGDA